MINLTANNEVQAEWNALQLSEEYTVETLCEQIGEEIKGDVKVELEADEQMITITILSWNGEMVIEAFDVEIEEWAIPEHFGHFFQVKGGELQLDEDYAIS